MNLTESMIDATATHRHHNVPSSAVSEPRGDHAELITELLEYAEANTDEPAMFGEAGASLMREAAAALSELSPKCLDAVTKDAL